MNKLYCFEKDGQKFKNEHKCDFFHPDGELHFYKIFLNEKEITKTVLEWYKKAPNHFHLGYIGFKEEFQNKGLLKNFIHPHCVEFMKTKGIEKITLKPLATAFIVWIGLGFEIIKSSEEKAIKEIIADFLINKGIIPKEDFNKISLNKIVEKYKEILKSEEFPPKLEKAFYTYFEKVLK